MKFGVICVSDRCSKGIYQDKSGPLISELVSHLGETAFYEIVPDEKELISQALIHGCDKTDADVIFTTGGTGFAPRDVTPEATKAVLEREAPGISEAIRQKSLEITSKAMLSRAVSGIRGQTLIVNLPGSPKAVREALEIVMPVLPHAVETLSGITLSCAGKHSEEHTDFRSKEDTQGFSLKDKSALILGCGGLGCNIAVHLAGAGIGKLMLCDKDSVSSGNLNRQFLYTRADIGERKVTSARRRLKQYSPECDISAWHGDIRKSSELDFAKDCDIIFSAVDNDKARLILKEFSDKYGIPLVLGGIDGFYGMANLYLPGESEFPPICETEQTAELSVSATAGVIGSLQAALGIRFLLTKDPDISKKLLVYDETEINTLKLK